MCEAWRQRKLRRKWQQFKYCNFATAFLWTFQIDRYSHLANNFLKTDFCLLMMTEMRCLFTQQLSATHKKSSSSSSDSTTWNGNIAVVCCWVTTCCRVCDPEVSAGGLIATERFFVITSKVSRSPPFAVLLRAEEAWSAFRVLSTKRPTLFSKSSSRTW